MRNFLYVILASFLYPFEQSDLFYNMNIPFFTQIGPICLPFTSLDFPEYVQAKLESEYIIP
mgnify:CR=1 FL=1